MRTICVVATNRSDYGRLHPVMEALKSHQDIELKVVVGSAAYFDGLWWYLRYAKVSSLPRSLFWLVRARLIKIFGGERAVLAQEQLSRMVQKDGYEIAARLPLLIEGSTPPQMVAAAGTGLLKLADIFSELTPDLVLINGDRFEILPVAVAAAYMNIRVAHIEGGDVSGTIDNSIRHAISKFAHLHFPATTESAARLERMGEDPATIFTHGSPIIDTLRGIDTSLGNDLHDRYPKDLNAIDLTKPYVVVMQHPVTTEYEDSYAQTKELLAALDTIGMPQFFIAPNIDAGSDGIATALSEYRNSSGAARSIFHKHLSLEDYIKVFASAAVAVGNSSSFLREGAYLGVPCVVVGSRQRHRERGENVIEVEAKREPIADAMRKQIAHGRYPSDLRFGKGDAATQIAQTLASIDLDKVSIQKYFHEERPRQ
jgi:UDP-hydrolysing UDP-N-acetyl-D-glucosamine 2-epimerase